MKTGLFILAAVLLAIASFAVFLKAPEYLWIGWAGLAVGFAALAVPPPGA